MQVFLGGEASPDWESLFKRVGVPYMVPHVFTRESPGDGLAPYQSTKLLSFNGTTKIGASLYSNMLFRLRFVGCYCSVYDDCWSFESGFGENSLPHTQEGCPNRPQVIFGHTGRYRPGEDSD
jgi:hypothetical protein